jgi:bidirectional [NiFe] hydrogenase diaphorase subunit
MPTTGTKKKGVQEGHPSGDPRYKGIDRVLKKQHYQQDALIEVLTSAQEAFGYLPEEVLIYIARQLKLPFSWVYGVATFYHFFSLKPQGEHTCIVCLGTACYVGKANEIVDALQDEFHIDAGQTTPDGKLTLTTTRCLGCCGLAPVVVLGEQVLGKETPESTVAKVKARLAGAQVEAAVAAEAMSGAREETAAT